MGNSLQCFPRDPRRAAFVTNDRTPTSGADLLALAIATTANRACSRDHDQPGLAVGRAVQRDVTIGKQLDRLNFFQTVFDFFERHVANVFAAHSRQADRRMQNIISMHAGFNARAIDRLSYIAGRVRNADAQRVRWTSVTFTDDTLLLIHDDRARTCATTVDAGDKQTRIARTGLKSQWPGFLLAQLKDAVHFCDFRCPDRYNGN